MVEKALVDGMVLVKSAETGDIAAAVTAVATWIDLSTKALTYNIADTRANSSTRPHGTNPRSRVTAGAVTGTISMTFLRDSNSGGVNPEAVLEAIHKSHGRMQFAIQDDRSELLEADGTLMTAEASDTNPQYASSAIISSVDYFGVADGNGGTAAVVSVTADLDRDFARYDS